MRYLLINADDFGIGPETSRGILELARQGAITSSVLLSNSPHAEAAVGAWRRSGLKLELGWHPTLTLDRPVLPPEQVPSLVDAAGNFWTLAHFMARHFRGRIRPAEVHLEFAAQYRRCCDLLGQPPDIVNTHHHIQIFSPIGTILKSIIRNQKPVPYMRLVREPWPMLWRIGGVRLKRLFLNWHGRRAGRRQRHAGLLGNDWLVGLTDHTRPHHPDFFLRWIARVPGNVVELTCHPGFRDESLLGRDCVPGNGMLERRPQELALLLDPRLRRACAEAGFTVISPSQLRTIHFGHSQQAA